MDTLNALACGYSADVPQAHDDLDGSATQQEVLNYVHACHASLAPCEERRADEALLALLRRDSVYSQGSQSKLAVYTPGNVSLPERSHVECQLLDLLGGDAKHHLEHVETLCLLSEEELAGRLDCGPAPIFVDEVLRRDQRLYEEFVADLWRRRLIDFSETVKVINGIFVVSKTGWQATINTRCSSCQRPLP